MSSNGTFDFAHLNIDGATARFDMEQLGPGGFLIVRSATKQNRDYWSAMMAASAGRQRLALAVKGRDVLPDEDQERDRAEDAVLFAKHVIVGGLARSSSGKMVAVTPENAFALTNALVNAAPWLFERLRAFCFRHDNFVGLPAPVDASPAELAKN